MVDVKAFLRRSMRLAQTPTHVDTHVASVEDTAASLAAVLFAQQRWQLRKVESRLFQEGAYSLTRVSIDCVPQALPALRYVLEGAGMPGDSLLLVPITVIKKGTLRSFDMRDSAGNPMPVIGRSEYSGLMVETLLHELDAPAVRHGAEKTLRRALTAVVDADASYAADVAVELVVDGTFNGVACLNTDEMTTYVTDLILSLADSYLLIALLPEEHAGRRQVIKYGHHSEERFEGTGPIKRLRLAAGLEALKVTFDLSHPAGSASHHFEMVIPTGLRCERLAMPPGRKRADRNTLDTTPTGVAHAVATYDANPIQGVEAEFRVPFEGLRQTAALVCLVTGLILLLGVALPGAQHALLQANDGAAALLLAVPALVFALAGGGGEHAMVAWILRPLRMVVIGCALLLLACAGSIVGVLHEGWRSPMWWTGAGATLATATALAWTALRVRVRRLVLSGG